MDHGTQVPEYFICPISLQIMKDPVTTITGISYDRVSIEQWLSHGRNKTCPVTKQELPIDTELIPNHTLRRLIQAWCTTNSTSGIGQIPTPKAQLDKPQVIKLLQELSHPQLQLNCLKKLHEWSIESEQSRKCVEEAGAVKAMVPLMVKWSKEGGIPLVVEALGILELFRITYDDLKLPVSDDYTITKLVMSILQGGLVYSVEAKTNAILVLQHIFEVARLEYLEVLRQDFFECITRVLKEGYSHKAVKASLHILLKACPWGRNQIKIIEAGGVSELIELELSQRADKRTTELILCVLEHLCRCQYGRDRFVSHPAGIAVIAKRILRVSPVVDEQGVRILSRVCKLSATEEVVQEMLRVGAVTKLSMVIQTDCATQVKHKARGVLRLHSNVWNNSPCVALYLITRYC